ncbi:PREDICTED: uncharacterized protein LOC109585024 [Amphimedon queenslandica]|uniref:Cadherin domain-containing protein n=1 Tax=Amphimedon queenslandica TaxID=400682 RepID=A0AAN0JHK0_AMPQE|nr:PREDICTED: uncharacterized protein LOC109585024 [Amphimedon queenslandica]|eukprot:XP_019856510.1 PREDICTED: uncharacterized protein LOC109585024 [Amphimedon queenslandica]
MTTVCCTAVKTILLCLALFVGLSCLGCVNQTPNCTNFSGVDNRLAPQNVTVQTGENATFTSKSTCHSMKVYVNGCEASRDSVRLSSDGDMTTLTYTAINASLDESGSSVEFIMFCNGPSCYHKVYLTVLDPPIEPANVTVNTTCSGFNISFISSDATVVTVTSSNGTMIYNGTLEPSVNFIEINNSIRNNEVYELRLKSYNEVGQSKYIIENINTDINIVSFEISDVSIKYVNDVPQANVTLNVDNDCILSVPCTVDVKCACLSNTSQSIFLNGIYQFVLNLVNYKEMCGLTVEAGTLQVHKLINTTAVTSFTVTSHVTIDGYFHVNATLQKGVTGIMMQVQYINGTLFFKQPILRKPSSDYAGANNTRPLPNGTFYLSIYMLKSDGVSFDLLQPIKKNIVITSLIKSPDKPNEPKQHGFPTWAIIFIVVVITLILTILVAALLGCYFSQRGEMRRIQEQEQGPAHPVVLVGPPAPVHQGDPPLHQGDPPVRQGDPLVHQGDPPVHQEDPPVHQEDPPVHQGDPLVHQGDAPVHQGDPLVRQEDPPVHQEDPPVLQRDPSIQGDPPVPPHQEDPPVHQGEGDLPVPADPPVQAPQQVQEDPLNRLELSIPSIPTNLHLVLTEPVPPLSSPVSANPPTLSNIFENFGFNINSQTNDPSVSIQNNSVTYSSTGDGSDCPLMKHDHAPVASSYRFTPSQSTEEEKFKKPEEVKASGGPFKFVYSWRSNK